METDTTNVLIRSVSHKQEEDVTQTPHGRIEELLCMSEEQLFAELGKAAFADEFLDFDQQVSRGKTWFKPQHQRVYNKLCIDWQLCERIDDPKLADKTELVSALADVLSVYYVGMPLFVISALIAKLGAREFCRCSNKRT
jgi:hypothetical protein